MLSHCKTVKWKDKRNRIMSGLRKTRGRGGGEVCYNVDLLEYGMYIIHS
jgi:hypothetical protein